MQQRVHIAAGWSLDIDPEMEFQLDDDCTAVADRNGNVAAVPVVYKDPVRTVKIIVYNHPGTEIDPGQGEIVNDTPDSRVVLEQPWSMAGPDWHLSANAGAHGSSAHIEVASTECNDLLWARSLVASFRRGDD